MEISMSGAVESANVESRGDGEVGPAGSEGGEVDEVKAVASSRLSDTGWRGGSSTVPDAEFIFLIFAVRGRSVSSGLAIAAFEFGRSEDGTEHLQVKADIGDASTGCAPGAGSVGK